MFSLKTAVARDRLVEESLDEDEVCDCRDCVDVGPFDGCKRCLYDPPDEGGLYCARCRRDLIVEALSCVSWCDELQPSFDFNPRETERHERRLAVRRAKDKAKAGPRRIYIRSLFKPFCPECGDLVSGWKRGVTPREGVRCKPCERARRREKAARRAA